MPEISTGVRELLSVMYGPRNLSRRMTHPALLQQGIQGHKDATSNRPPEYQREVPVELAWIEENWRLRVRGRIDGLLDTGEYILVEEIKTTWLRDVQQLLPEHNQFYTAQLILYAYFIASEYPDRDIKARLTWWHLGDEEEVYIDLTDAQVASGRALFIQLCQEYIRRERAHYQWRQQRNAALAEMTFPFSDFRPGQEELVQTTALALDQKQDLMVEAATGIGKTVAVLIPALAWLAKAPSDAKVFFLTAKTSGREIVLETLKRLPNLELRTIFLEAKERSCTHPDSDCDTCELAQDFYPRAHRILPRMLEERLLTPEIIKEYAQDEGLCSFELSLEAATQADLVVADYNYAFDPLVQLQRFFGRGNRIAATLLIDEAHNLVSRGRDMFSADLGKKQILDLHRDLKTHPTLGVLLKELNAIFIQWNKDLKSQGGGLLLLDKLPRGVKTKLSRLAEEIAVADHDSPILKEFTRRLVGSNKILQLLGPEHAIYVCRQDQDTVLNLFCLNPGPLLQKQRKGCNAVFFSATLSPGDYYRKLLGCKDEYLDVSLASPFPEENRLFVHIPGVKTTYAAREGFYLPVARYISSIVQQQPGNYLAFFPSYAYLQEVAAHLQFSPPPGYQLHIQQARMDIQEREELLARMTGPGANLGLAVMGGLYGEGVDMPGDKLIGTIIVGPGLPMVSARQQLIQNYFDGHEHSGFMYAYVIPGLLRVVQSAGRVFRTPEDKGIVVLLDDRFRQDGYRQLLPAHWQEEGLFTRNWLQRIRNFWR